MSRHPYEIVKQTLRVGGAHLMLIKVDLDNAFGISSEMLDLLNSKSLCLRCGNSVQNIDFHKFCQQKDAALKQSVHSDFELQIPEAELISFWRQNRSDGLKRHSFKRSRWIKNSPSSHTSEQIERLKELQEYKCFYCFASLIGPDGHINGPNNPTTCHKDHYISLAQGGSDDIANIVLACPDCNMRKGDIHGDDFRQESLRRATQETKKDLKRIHSARENFQF